MLLLSLGALAATPVRYHTIVVANDDVAWDDANNRWISTPSALELSEARDVVPLPAGQPIGFTARDALRFARLMGGNAPLAQLEVLLPPGRTPGVPGLEGPTGAGYPYAADVAALWPGDPAALHVSTREEIRAAFDRTRCRIAAAKGRAAEGCAAPTEAGSRGRDVVFVHVAAHGLPGGFIAADGGLYWDGDVEGRPGLSALLRGLDADLVVVTFDACRVAGGDTAARVRQEVRAPDNVVVFAATDAVPSVADLRGGAFTHVLVSALSGAADENRDAAVSYLELADFLELHLDQSNAFHIAGARPQTHRHREVFRLPEERDDVAVPHVPFSVTSPMDGRLLVTDAEGGALLETRLPAPPLVLPRDVQPQLYFLDDPRGGPSSGVARRAPTEAASFALGNPTAWPPASDAPASWLTATQQHGSVFSRAGWPAFALRAPERQIQFGGSAGYSRVPAYGSVRDAELASIPAWEADRYEWMQESSAATWNCLRAGLDVRFLLPAPVSFLYAEGGAAADLAPRVRVSSDDVAVVIGRAWVGGGLITNVGGRRWFAYGGASRAALAINQTPVEDPATGGATDGATGGATAGSTTASGAPLTWWPGASTAVNVGVLHQVPGLRGVRLDVRYAWDAVYGEAAHAVTDTSIHRPYHVVTATLGLSVPVWY